MIVPTALTIVKYGDLGRPDLTNRARLQLVRDPGGDR